MDDESKKVNKKTNRILRIIFAELYSHKFVKTCYLF